MRLIILFLCSSFICNGQEFTIKTIHEINLTSIADVRILILDQDSEIITITSTNQDGELILKIPQGTYTIEASHLSYEKWSQTVILTPEKKVYEIKLAQRVENLEEMVINSSGYMRKHGDTTTINLPKIVNGKERNVIDVLKKIKGVQVLEDGTVIYNKKEVTNVLINGNKIFDNDYKSALDKIKPYEMVKIQFIENYKDDTNSNLLAKESMAMNLGFKNELFISGTVEGGLGVSSVRLLNLDILQNAKWITTFLNAGNQNIGMSEANELLQSELLNANVTSHYTPRSFVTLGASGLHKIKATDFNDTYATRLNTAIKLSKKTRLLIKSNNTWEDLSRLNRNTSQFIIDDQVIMRNELNNQKVNYSNSENNIGILHKNKQSVFKSEFYFKNTNHEYLQNIDLNGISNEQIIDEKRQQFNLDLKYERIISNEVPIVFNAGYYHNPSRQNLTNTGFSNVTQRLDKNENVYYANASLLKRRSDSSIVGLQIGSKLSGIKQDLDLQINPSILSSREQLITNELKLNWEKESKKRDWQVKSGFNLYSFDLMKSYSYLKTVPFLDARLKLKSKSKASHTFTLSSITDWMLKNPFTPFSIFDAFNSSYAIGSTNDIMRTSHVSYLISDSKNLDNTFLSVNLLHNNKSLISDFDIDANTSQNILLISDKDTYTLGLNARYNTLLWKLFFFESSLTSTLGNTFFINNNDEITETINRSYLGIIKFNRRFTKQLFIGSTTQIRYNEFESNLGTNDILNYDTTVYFIWEFGDFELKGDYNHTKIGENQPVNFSSFHLGYTPKKSNFKADLQLFNLFNTESISTTNASNIGKFTSSINLPQRRLIASLTYTF